MMFSFVSLSTSFRRNLNVSIQQTHYNSKLKLDFGKDLHFDVACCCFTSNPIPSLQENSFVPANKSALESTVSFLNELASAVNLPSDLQTDATHCLRILTADSCGVQELTQTLQTLDALRTADESTSLGIMNYSCYFISVSLICDV